MRQLVQSKRTVHSAKPDSVKERIHAMFPTQRKIELFARFTDPDLNWDAWGAEVESTESVELLLEKHGWGSQSR